MQDMNTTNVESADPQHGGHGALDGHRDRRLIGALGPGPPHFAGSISDPRETKAHHGLSGEPWEAKAEQQQGGTMPKIAKKQAAAKAVVDRTKKYTLAEACTLVKKAAPAKFDETVDLAFAWVSIPATPTRWSVAPSCSRTARGRRFASSSSPRATRRRRPRRPAPTRRRGRPRDQGPGGLHGLRPRDRDAGHDGSGRQARSYPRPPRPHAEPEGRHRHLRREDRRGRGEGRQGRVPRREGGHRPRPHRQGLVHRAGAQRQRRTR
jgi:hypothetical protein